VSVDRPLRDRVVLGTVQLGLPYARRRGERLMGLADAFRILDQAWEMGVRAFDTAEAYGESAPRVRQWLHERGRLDEADVVTKAHLSDDARELCARVQAALSRFDGSRSVTFLTHGSVDETTWHRVVDAGKRSRAIIGQSVYDAEEVRAACALGATRVQAPGNVFDRRAIDARGKARTRLDLRSVFLQGVLLDSEGGAEARASGGGALARAVALAANDAGVDAASALIGAIAAHLGDGDRLVIGVDDGDQLALIRAGVALDASRTEAFAAALRRHAPPSIEPRALDPRQWSS
jgi:aryl-alcohol dehydrogenase-like predicted oxidoreductase